MAELNIALLQIAADGDNQDANLVRGDAACRSARELGADIALFPEMWSNGYSFARGARHDDRWRAPGKWESGEVQLDDDELIALARYRSQATPVNGPLSPTSEIWRPSSTWPSPSLTSKQRRPERAILFQSSTGTGTSS